MADLRLDRADGTPLLRLSVSLGKYAACALELGDVARLGGSAVCLQQLNRARRISGSGIRAAQRVRLSTCLGRIDGRAFAVGAGAHAANHGIDAIAVALSVFEPAQRQHTQAFAENGAVGTIRKGAAVAAGRQGGRLAKAHVHQDIVERIHAADDHHVRLPHVQLAQPHGQRRKRAGTCRIYHAVGAAQVKLVGDAAGDHVAEQTRK